jgi:AraC-like DNA-binding protein
MHSARTYPATIYLAVYFLLISLYALNQYAILYSKSVTLVSIVYTNITFLFYLIGPIGYWYVRSILTEDSRLRKIDFWHFIPMVVHLVCSIPYLLTSYSYKVEIANSIISDVGFIGEFHATVLSDLFSNSFIYLSRPVLALIYTIWSTWLLLHYLFPAKKSVAFPLQYFMKKWLLFFLGFQFVLIFSHLFAISQTFLSDTSALFFTVNALQILSLLGLIGLLITPFFFPGILYGLPVSPTPTPSLETAGNELSFSTSDLKKNAHTFELDYIVTIIQKMATCMQEQQPYLQNDFNLTHFSVLIDIPAHHLVYFFREVKKQSFNEYRNECRVNHAKMLILEGKADHLTLEAIGSISGFATRNTFFTAFKKVEGISPSAFVAQMGK